VIIEVNNISFAYERNPEVLREISFTVAKGQIICILGPNGVGKTTLLNCMANLIQPTKGKILLDGKDMRELSPKDIAMKAAYVPQFIIPSFAYEVLGYVVTGCAPRIGIFEKPKEAHYQAARQSLEVVAKPYG
jgi:iron complex transport system ATP-binding protein